MKTLFKTLFAPLLWFFQSCSPLGNPVNSEKSDSHYYNNSKSEIRYSPMGNWFELGNTEMKADIESFKVFNSWLSRDKDHIFFEAYEIKSSAIDLSTFETTNKDYMKDIGFDKNRVYSFSKVVKNQKYYGTVKVIEGANPKTYERTNWDWANDGIHHYYKNNKLAVDFDSFQPLNDYFAKDSSSTYVRNDTLFIPFEGDAVTLSILDRSSHGIDAENVYWLPFFTKDGPNLITLPYSNVAEVEFLNRYFLRIANTIYIDGVARPDIDTQSFKIIDHSYAKDANHVYYKDKTIPNADPESFKQMEKSYKYVDKNGTYHEGKQEEKEAGNP